MKLFATLLLIIIVAVPVSAQNFRSDSKRFVNSKMDIVITETEQRPRTSVLTIEVNKIGSSVGSSFFIVCSLRDLARQRGNHRYIVKVEDQPSRGRMLVGFLHSINEAPELLDSRLAGQQAIDLEQFAPICDRME